MENFHLLYFYVIVELVLDEYKLICTHRMLRVFLPGLDCFWLPIIKYYIAFIDLQFLLIDL